MTLADNVKKFRDEQKLSQQQLADRVGVSQPTIALIENGGSKTTKYIFRLAKVLGVTVTDLDPTALRNTLPAPSNSQNSPDEKDFPIYSAVEGGSGSIIVSWDPMEWSVRPGPLLNIKGGYGMYVVGDSMFPAYDAGDVALINPYLPPAPQRNAVFFRTDAGGSSEGLIKRIVKITPNEWVVEQWNPAKTYHLPKSEWPQCHVVIGKYDR